MQYIFCLVTDVAGNFKLIELRWLQEFNFGVEFVLLMAFVDSAFGVPVDDALASLEKLAAELPSLIVQSTQGEFEMKNAQLYFQLTKLACKLLCPCSVSTSKLENVKFLSGIYYYFLNQVHFSLTWRRIIYLVLCGCKS